jgi:hypothetical protein
VGDVVVQEQVHLDQMNNGSVDSLNVCERCGARAKARQIREIADFDMPVAAAIERVDQWVAFFGFSSRRTARPDRVRGSAAARCGPCPE